MTSRLVENKILSLAEAKKRRDAARASGKKVVFTNGCFDIVHRGHVKYLEKAQSLGDLLILGLNTDASVKRIKTGGRPVVGEKDRAIVVAAFEFVDIVCFFDEDTPAEIIAALRPDVLVKGADYAVQDIVGHKQVLADGGKVIPIELEPGASTTSIIEKIKRLSD